MIPLTVEESLGPAEDDCATCGGGGWVCEQHPDLPLEHDDCPGPGDPCPCRAGPQLVTVPADLFREADLRWIEAMEKEAEMQIKEAVALNGLKKPDEWMTKILTSLEKKRRASRGFARRMRRFLGDADG